MLARAVADIRHDCSKIYTHIFRGNGQELIERLENRLLDYALLTAPNGPLTAMAASLPFSFLIGSQRDTIAIDKDR